jgi:hypothetical protein
MGKGCKSNLDAPTKNLQSIKDKHEDKTAEKDEAPHRITRCFVAQP